MTVTPGRPTPGQLNPGDLGAGGKIRPTYFDDMGNPGKGMDVEDIDGAIVKTAAVAGGILTLGLQLPDGSARQLQARVNDAGVPTYIATAEYDSSLNRISLALDNPPASLSNGDSFLFIGPANLHSSPFAETPVPNVSGGSGSGATIASISVNNDGLITTIMWDSHGTGYMEGDIITLTQGTAVGTYELQASDLTGTEIGDLAGLSIRGRNTNPPSAPLQMNNDVESGTHPLGDVNFNPVKAFDLSPDRVYLVSRLIHPHSHNPYYVFRLPLHLLELEPVQEVTVNITNAQIKELDQTYVELIPAPGAGKYIELLSVTFTTAGDDQATKTEVAGQVDPEDIASWGWNILLYETAAGKVASKPLYRTDPPEYTWVDGHRLSTFYGSPSTAKWTKGGQVLQENAALMYGVIFNLGSRTSPPSWSAAAYDQFIATCNDNTISMTLRYVIGG